MRSVSVCRAAATAAISSGFRSLPRLSLLELTDDTCLIGTSSCVCHARISLHSAQALLPSDTEMHRWRTSQNRAGWSCKKGLELSLRSKESKCCLDDAHISKELQLRLHRKESRFCLHSTRSQLLDWLFRRCNTALGSAGTTQLWVSIEGGRQSSFGSSLQGQPLITQRGRRLSKWL